MAIDYGTRRVGIAVTDPLQIIATPVTTITPDKLIGFIKEFVIKQSLDEIVVGYPLREDGSFTHITAKVEQLIEQLKKKFPAVRLVKHDERYTSKMAVQSMVTGGTKKKERQKKANLDKISATLILQSYMEEKDLSS